MMDMVSAQGVCVVSRSVYLQVVGSERADDLWWDV